MDPVNDIDYRQDAGPPLKENEVTPKMVKLEVSIDTIKKFLRWIKERVKYA
jgi:hypothetical protein